MKIVLPSSLPMFSFFLRFDNDQEKRKKKGKKKIDIPSFGDKELGLYEKAKSSPTFSCFKFQRDHICYMYKILFHKKIKEGYTMGKIYRHVYGTENNFLTDKI